MRFTFHHAVAAAVVLTFAIVGCGSEICSGTACACPSGDTCDEGCAEGHCSQACAANSTCTFECEGGGCNQSCDPTANCTFHCSGGGCTQACPAGKCTADCTGSNCIST